MTEMQKKEIWEKRFPSEDHFGVDISAYTRLVYFDSEETILREGPAFWGRWSCWGYGKRRWGSLQSLIAPVMQCPSHNAETDCWRILPFCVCSAVFWRNGR